MLKKLIYRLLFSTPPDSTKTVTNIFDLPSRERVRLLRAAGKSAQKEQKELVERYYSTYGTAQ